MTLINILFVLVILLFLIYLYLQYSLTYWKRRGVFSFPTIPLLGNAINMVTRKVFIGSEFGNYYKALKEKGLKYGGYYFLTKPIFIPVDPQLIRNIVIKDFSHFTDHSCYINEEVEPITGHLFGLQGDRWKILRKKLNPAFTSSKMKMMFETLLNCTEGLIPLIKSMDKELGVIHMKEVMERYTTDVIGSCAFGVECHTLETANSDVRTQTKKILEPDLMGSIRNLLVVGFPKLMQLFRINFIPKSSTEFFMSLSADSIKYREENNETRNDLIQLLIKLKNGEDIGNDEESEDLLTTKNNNDNFRITLNQIGAQSFLFFMAGYETSSAVSTYLLYELALNLPMQGKVRDEIRTILKKYDNKVTYEAVVEMEYLDRCLREALRKYPPLSLIFRVCTQDYKIPETDVVIEKDTAVFVPMMGVHYDTEFYPDPERFDPERFSVEEKAKRPTVSWVPFGEGPRICIGMRLGLLQMKISIITLLREYEFTLDPKCEVPFQIDPKIPLIINSKQTLLFKAKRMI